MEKNEHTVLQAIAAVVLGFMLVVMLMQGGRVWNMLERLVKVETKVEIYHELDQR